MRRGLRLPSALIVDEEEGLILNERASECSAKLILAEYRGGVAWVGEVILGVQGSVAQKFEPASVEVVRARLGHDIDLTAAVVSVFRVEVIGDDAEFGNRIQIGNDRRTVRLAFLNVRTVHHESIGGLALTVDRLAAGIQSTVHWAIVDTGHAGVGGGVRRNARLQGQQVGESAAIQRNRGHGLTADNLAHLRAFRFDVNRIGRDLNLLARRADGEGGVGAKGRVGVNH